MNIRNNASIAYALTSLVASFADDPAYGNPAYGSLTAGVLSRAPGDGAQKILRELAETLGLKMVEVRTPHIEYHPGAIAAISEEIEKAVATDVSVIVLLDDAHGAADGVIAAISRSLSKRVEESPCILLAISTSSGERDVTAAIAEGLCRLPGDILTYRTSEENLRLTRKIIEAME